MTTRSPAAVDLYRRLNALQDLWPLAFTDPQALGEIARQLVAFYDKLITNLPATMDSTPLEKCRGAAQDAVSAFEAHDFPAFKAAFAEITAHHKRFQAETSPLSRYGPSEN